MARTPIAASARQDRITVRFTADEMRQINKMRGPLTVASYIRHLIRQDVIARRAVESIIPEG